MPRSGGTYTRTNGVHTGATVWAQDEAAGTDILAARMDAHDQDIADALTASLTKDGQTTPTANLPMGGYKHTGLGSGSAATDSVNLGQVQAQDYIWCGTAGGTKNALTLTPSPAITAYAAGQRFRFIAGGTDSDDATTIAVSGLENKAGQIDNAAMSATAYFEAGKLYEIDYDGTQFQVTRLSGAFLASDGDGSGLSGIRIQGKDTIWIPATAMRPTTSNGCASITDVETTAGRPDLQVLDFDASSDEHAQFQVSMPKSWNEGTITYQVFWTSTATDTDGVTWALQGVACADGDTIDVAYGTAVTVDDANQSTAEDLYATAESGAVTIAGTPAAGDLCFFRVFRDVSDANDTAAEDARLIGVKIFFTSNAGDDT